MLENIVIILLVVCSLLFLAKRYYRTFQRTRNLSDSGCGEECSGCPNGGKNKCGCEADVQSCRELKAHQASNQQQPSQDITNPE
jgi:hypothetical protein